MAYRVFDGSFRGGHWRYLPIRNHDNRSSADWIRLCPGLSKNSENGNSCPKPHKAARHVWSSGQSGQHWDWDYEPQYGFHHGEAHGFAKENWRPWRSEWTKRVAVELECGYSPQDKTNRNLIFFGSPLPALALAMAAVGKSTLGRALQWDTLAFLPHSTDTCWLHIHTHTHILITNYYTYTTYMHSLPHPRSLASVALNRQPDKRVCD